VDDSDDGVYSRAPTIDDVARISRALSEAGARFVLIGGFAVIVHGSGRTTKDIDLLVDPSPENVARVKQALGILPDNAVAEIDDGDVEKYQVVRVADEVIVDLLGQACGVTYEHAAADAEEVSIGSVQVPVASKQTLIRTKQTIRPSDHGDCEYLRSRIEAAAEPRKSLLERIFGKRG
jgi:predicted nucleotidyltransferase